MKTGLTFLSAETDNFVLSETQHTVEPQSKKAKGKQKIKNREILSHEIKLALTSSVLSVRTHFFSQNGALVCFFPYISLDEASPSKKSPNSKKENFHEEEDDL